MYQCCMIPFFFCWIQRYYWSLNLWLICKLLKSDTVCIANPSVMLHNLFICVGCSVCLLCISCYIVIQYIFFIITKRYMRFLIDIQLLSLVRLAHFGSKVISPLMISFLSWELNLNSWLRNIGIISLVSMTFHYPKYES